MERVDYQQLLVQDILNLNNSGELDYSPWYQRRSVWTIPQKSYLINTLHEQKPIPTIYLRYMIDLDRGKTIREVVDGQQRIRAILEYCRDQFSALFPDSGDRRLLSQLNRVQRQNFLITSIPVAYLLGASDIDVIEIFGRINSVSKTLNPQERRNSKFSGSFKQFCLSQAATRVEFWRSYNIFTANDIARMQEVQFVSDLTFNLLYGLSDLNHGKLNGVYEKFDNNFPCDQDLAIRLDHLFDFIVDLNSSVISDTIFNRQPIFFSLLLILDTLQSLDAKSVEDALFDMDARYNLPNEQQTLLDRNFVAASTSSTQRLNQRQIRHSYIKSFLS